MKRKLFVIIILSLIGPNLFSQGDVNQSAEDLFQKCKSSLEAGKIDESIEFGKKAVELKPDVAEYYYYLSLAYQKKLEDASGFARLEPAFNLKEALEKAHQLDPTDPDIQYRLGKYYFDAPGIAGGSMAKAKESAKGLISKDPLKGYTLFCYIFDKEKNYPELEKSLKKAFNFHLEFKKKNPDQISVFNNWFLNSYGYYLLGEGKIDEAIEIFRMNILAHPDYYNVYDSYAEANAKKGKYKIALENYEKAAKLNPRETEIQKRNYGLQVSHIKELKAMIKNQ